MAKFPTLGTGAITQYPSARRTGYSTKVKRFVDGKEQRFRNIGKPVRTWAIRLRHVSEEEVSKLARLFLTVQGEFGSFSFVDPWDGMEYPDCSFEQKMFDIVALADGRYESHLIIRDNAS
jgi:hypothetical protein